MAWCFSRAARLARPFGSVAALCALLHPTQPSCEEAPLGNAVGERAGSSAERELGPGQACASAAAADRSRSTAKWRVFTDIGRDLVSKGELDEAERYLRRALAEARAGFGPADAHTAAALNNLAELHRLRRQWDEAVPLYEEALAVLETSLGAAHPSVGSTLHNLAGMYLQKRDFGAAARTCSSALSKKEEALGRLHPEYASSLAQLAEVHRLQGRLADSAALLRESTDILDAIGAGQSRVAVGRLSRLAHLLTEMGLPAEAITIHRRLVQAAESRAEEAPQEMARAQAELAEALSATPGGSAEARELCRRSLVLALSLLGESHPFVACIRRRLVDAMLGDTSLSPDALSEARSLIDAAIPVLAREAALPQARPASAVELSAALLTRLMLLQRMGDVGDAAVAAWESASALPPSFRRDALLQVLRSSLGPHGNTKQ